MKKESLAVKKGVILDLIQDLRRLLLPLWLRNDARGRSQIKFGMTSLCNRGGVGMTECVVCGFTLIELLVVVLIIGILAAVALPQYNKVVKKAQGREVLVALDALDKALQTYALENGKLGSNLPADALNVQLPVFTHFYYVKPYGGGKTRNFNGLGVTPTLLFYKDKESAFGGMDLTVEWNGRTGIRSSAVCRGKECSAYFDCVTEEQKRCPVQGFNAENCPIPISVNYSCQLN